MVQRVGRALKKGGLLCQTFGGRSACQLVEEKEFNLLNWPKESTGNRAGWEGRSSKLQKALGGRLRI